MCREVDGQAERVLRTRGVRNVSGGRICAAVARIDSTVGGEADLHRSVGIAADVIQRQSNYAVHAGCRWRGRVCDRESSGLVLHREVLPRGSGDCAVGRRRRRGLLRIVGVNCEIADFDRANRGNAGPVIQHAAPRLLRTIRVAAGQDRWGPARRRHVGVVALGSAVDLEPEQIFCIDGVRYRRDCGIGAAVAGVNPAVRSEADQHRAIAVARNLVRRQSDHAVHSGGCRCGSEGCDEAAGLAVNGEVLPTAGCCCAPRRWWRALKLEIANRQATDGRNAGPVVQHAATGLLSPIGITGGQDGLGPTLRRDIGTVPSRGGVNFQPEQKNLVRGIGNLSFRNVGIPVAGSDSSVRPEPNRYGGVAISANGASGQGDHAVH